MKNLFIVGAQRSGTSYLYRVIDNHPNVQLAKPMKPEPKFFLKEELFRLGKEYYKSKYFDLTNKNILYLGEKGTSYMERPDAAIRIHSFFPNARILFILREPVSRAWSNYIFSKQSGLETKAFNEALKNDPKKRKYNKNISVNPFNYINRSQYRDFLPTYFNLFKPENIRIEIFEEFVGNIEAIQDLYEWMEVESNFKPANYQLPVNKSGDYEESLPTDILIELSKRFKCSNLLVEKYLGREIASWKIKNRS